MSKVGCVSSGKAPQASLHIMHIFFHLTSIPPVWFSASISLLRLL